MANSPSLYFDTIVIKISSKIDGPLINKTPSLTVNYNDITYSATLSTDYTDSSIGKYAFFINDFPRFTYAVNVTCLLACEGFSPLTFQCKTRQGDSVYDSVGLYPLTIAGQILRIKNAKYYIRQSIINRGGEVSSNACIDEYADIINNLEDLFDVCNYTYNAISDTAGLKEIGWNYKDIAYFKYNNLHPKSENVGDTYKITDANKSINIANKNEISQYKSNPNFKYCPKFSTYGDTSMSKMFYQCSSLISVPLFDSHNVTTMYSMFMFCPSLISIPKFDTSKVTDMGSMFNGCSSLKLIPEFDTSNATSMSSMFKNCSSLTTVPLLDVSKVTSIYWMFYKCSSLTTLGGLDGLKIDLDLSHSPLTKESILNVFNKAANVTSSPKTLTLGSSNLKKLNSDEKKIATDKGWTLK